MGRLFSLQKLMVTKEFAVGKILTIVKTDDIRIVTFLFALMTLRILAFLTKLTLLDLSSKFEVASLLFRTILMNISNRLSE